MEAVAPNSLFIKLMGDCVLICNVVVATMKGGVEAGDLRQRREVCQQRFDRREIVGLMKRRQRNVAL
jgi:hypothetical protein